MVPDSYDYLVRAKALADERRPTEAREAVGWALAHAGSDDTEVLILAGIVLLVLGDAHAALSVALRAAEAEPDGWEPQALAADAYGMLERTPDAVAAARRAVALAPGEAEAQVALWRALAGSGRRGRRAELDAVARRAVELGADPARFRKPFLWLKVIPPLASAALVCLFDDWSLAAVLAVGAVLATGLWVAQARRSGTSASGRVLSMRSLARAEIAADPSRAGVAANHCTALLPLLPFVTTGLAAADGADGDPWSTWSVGFAAGGAVVVLLAGARAVSWWYGEAFLRGDLLPSRVAALQLGAVAALVGGALALSLAGTVRTGWWLALFLAHVGWFFAGSAVAVDLDVRDRRRRIPG